jgi:hypothetical protein
LGLDFFRERDLRVGIVDNFLPKLSEYISRIEHVVGTASTACLKPEFQQNGKRKPLVRRYARAEVLEEKAMHKKCGYA